MTRRGTRGRKKSTIASLTEQKTKAKERLIEQSRTHLNKQFKPGTSRHDEKIKNDLQFNQKLDTIHSYGTRKNYSNTQTQFINWCEKNVSDFEKKQSFRQLEKHVSAYLKDCEERGLSRQTVKTYRTGLSRYYESANAYEVSTTKDGQRGDVAREHYKHFSEEKNKVLVEISKGTGLRRNELQNLKVSDCKKIGNNWVIDVKGQYSKGGRSRQTVVSDKYTKTFETHIIAKQKELNYINDKLKSTTDDKEKKSLQNEYNRVNKVINQKLNSAMNIHGNRREYASDMLSQVRNNTKELNKIMNLTNMKDRQSNAYERKISSENYVSSKHGIDEKRDDLWVVSNQLGHSRLDVVVQSYLKK